MNLTSWLLYLEGLPSGSRTTHLVAVRYVAEELGLFDETPIITVAGTNGKGSTVIFLESMLRAHGFSVGGYISPHLLSYNERIRLNGRDIDDASLCLALTMVRRAAGEYVLSYFEFTTLAALLFFKWQKPDYLILEVGLGGRFDAVNIFDPLLAIITTISLDHTQILGETRGQIGLEKAHIMKPGGLAIVGPAMPDTVYSLAETINVQLYVLGEDFGYHPSSDNKEWSDWYFRETQFRNLPSSHLPMDSAALAIMATRLLLGANGISEENIRRGISEASLLGRMQEVVFRHRKIILDVAHNAEATGLLSTKLRANKKQGKLIALFNALSDKDIGSMVANLAGLVDHWYLGELKTERRSAIDLVAEEITKQDSSAQITLCSSISLALDQAIAESEEIDTIVAFGSFYVVAEALEIILMSIR